MAHYLYQRQEYLGTIKRQANQMNVLNTVLIVTTVINYKTNHYQKRRQKMIRQVNGKYNIYDFGVPEEMCCLYGCTKEELIQLKAEIDEALSASNINPVVQRILHVHVVYLT